jgi:co-chaperonin GroES (HSP10)
MGQDAYQDKLRFPSGPLCQPGDFVLFRAYSGSRFKFEGDEYRLINDDTVEATGGDPVAVGRP